jgi:hypothetical protein
MSFTTQEGQRIYSVVKRWLDIHPEMSGIWSVSEVANTLDTTITVGQRRLVLPDQQAAPILTHEVEQRIFTWLESLPCNSRKGESVMPERRKLGSPQGRIEAASLKAEFPEKAAWIQGEIERYLDDDLVPPDDMELLARLRRLLSGGTPYSPRTQSPRPFRRR